MEYVIQAEHLVKIYREGRTRVEGFKGVDLVVRPGELIAVMGASGAGRGTLSDILGLVTEPTRGRVTLDGENIWT